MKRILFSAIGVILTFIWIIYTAPAKSDKANEQPIKTINRSGASSIKTIKQPLNKTKPANRAKGESLLVNSASPIFVIAGNEKE